MLQEILPKLFETWRRRTPEDRGERSNFIAANGYIGINRKRTGAFTRSAARARFRSHQGEMKLLDFALPVVGFFGAYVLSRVFKKDRPELAILLSPALLIVIWTFVISGVAQAGIPLSAAWQYFWATTAVTSFFGCYIAFRDRHPDDILTILLTPLLTTSIVMAPYLYHGLAAFPGSWFWDGFAYIAMGESLWLHPRLRRPRA
jgi:hypothetical protein